MTVSKGGGCCSCRCCFDRDNRFWKRERERRDVSAVAAVEMRRREKEEESRTRETGERMKEATGCGC